METKTPKPDRLFGDSDRVVTKRSGCPMFAIVWGWEWSDGTTISGRPSVKYRGWFYHVRMEASGEEFIIPESAMVLVR